METKRKHIPTWLYKLGGRLDKQYEEIVSSLSDIYAFNAVRKRDKALELLSTWLPDVEKFSKEIGKQQAYIDSLKERIRQESDYAGRMRKVIPLSEVTDAAFSSGILGKGVAILPDKGGGKSSGRWHHSGHISNKTCYWNGN